ncbi:MAG: T9SS type A sorting domain-containing protein, partial [Bacteroidota bacterium]|nr:T9SS type A sorting domain-containing protein [Bacteroidota bacterium]
PGTITTIDQGLKILPVPAPDSVDQRLVHQVMVEAFIDQKPARFLCWVDAHTGKLWYRWDQVVECGHDHTSNDGADQDAGADVQVNATVYSLGPQGPTEVVGLPDLRVTVNGDFLYTDANGFLPTGITGPVNAQVQLRGRWANVTSMSGTPSVTVNLAEGANTVDLDLNSNIRERSAYHFVNQIHAQVNSILPDFTGMDMTLATNIDVNGGDCNAFYDGNSINFYAQGNGCHSLAIVGDVVYHEYGHGINDKFYQSIGSSFLNGAMNEGYADVWALSVSFEPILAHGYMMADPNSFIRRYDQDRKVYPIDLVGEVHSDGEIICGAWWDTYLLLGSDMDLTMQLFADAFPGLQATAFNGQEGMAFRDVLIDVLQADDDDGNITNGTPNGDQIIEGFALHGITLLSNVELEHEAVAAAPMDEAITLEAEVPLNFPYISYLTGVRTYYRINDSPTWESVLMINNSGDTYSASIPPQPEGNVIAYYMTLEDIFGQISSVLPIGANVEDPNLPNFILVGAEVAATEDGDGIHQFGSWSAGLPTDNAETGMWVWNVPTGSFATPGDFSTMVQPNFQHTEGGEFCWVTGNAANDQAALGENDVDDGTTTLLSSNIDMSAYQEPIFTYWRWYVNNPPSGANPNADWWQTFISNDGGNNWVKVEETKRSDRSWRRMAFRVRDYVEPTSMMKLRFNASDSIRAGQELEGGSLVEAAVDDMQLWDLAGGIGIPEHEANVISLYPDPANDLINVMIDDQAAKSISAEILDLSGRTVLRPVIAGTSIGQINVASLANGQYVLRLNWENGSSDRRFSIVR